MATQTFPDPGAAAEQTAFRSPGFRALGWPSDDTAAPGSVLSWAGILAATAIAVGALLLGTSLFNALAFSSGYAWFADNLAWLNAVTVAGTLLVGGLLAGWFCRRGIVGGFMNGLTVWGILMTGAVVFGIGSAAPLTMLSQVSRGLTTLETGSFWPTFVAYSTGFVMAGLGGFLGALIPHPVYGERDIALIDLRDSDAQATTATIIETQQETMFLSQ